MCCLGCELREKECIDYHWSYGVAAGAVNSRIRRTAFWCICETDQRPRQYDVNITHECKP